MDTMMAAVVGTAMEIMSMSMSMSMERTVAVAMIMGNMHMHMTMKGIGTVTSVVYTGLVVGSVKCV